LLAQLASFRSRDRAWIHGRAAERVPFGQARTLALTDDLDVATWTFDTRPSRYPVVAELPAVGVTR
jgi:hypothetical protein